MLLIYHDRNAVFRGTDAITVLLNGHVISSDKPQAVRNNAQVRVAYLGEH
jgi:branched-chain amino acid transport system ATP-binding protein